MWHRRQSAASAELRRLQVVADKRYELRRLRLNALSAVEGCGVAVSPSHVAVLWEGRTADSLVVFDAGSVSACASNKSNEEADSSTQNSVPSSDVLHSGLKIHTATKNLADWQFRPLSIRGDYPTQLLASAGEAEDFNIKLWKIGAPDEFKGASVSVADGCFSGHRRKTTTISFNPLCAEVLSSGGFDKTIKLWAIDRSEDSVSRRSRSVAEAMYCAELPGVPSSLSWRLRGGRELCVASKDKTQSSVSIIDYRQRYKALHTTSHTGRHTRACFLDGQQGREGLLVSTGYSTNNVAEIKLWDMKKMDTPLQCESLMQGTSSAAQVHWDEAAGLLFVNMKGSNGMKIFPLHPSTGCLQLPKELKVAQGREVCNGLAFFPKKCSESPGVEVQRAAAVMDQSMIRRVLFTSNRKYNSTESIVFAGLPALSLKEWREGSVRVDATSPIRMTMSSSVAHQPTAVHDIKEEPRRLSATSSAGDDAKCADQINEHGAVLAARADSACVHGPMCEQESPSLLDEELDRSIDDLGGCISAHGVAAIDITTNPKTTKVMQFRRHRSVQVPRTAKTFAVLKNGEGEKRQKGAAPHGKENDVLQRGDDGAHVSILGTTFGEDYGGDNENTPVLQNRTLAAHNGGSGSRQKLPPAKASRPPRMVPIVDAYSKRPRHDDNFVPQPRVTAAVRCREGGHTHPNVNCYSEDEVAADNSDDSSLIQDNELDERDCASDDPMDYEGQASSSDCGSPPRASRSVSSCSSASVCCPSPAAVSPIDSPRHANECAVLGMNAKSTGAARRGRSPVRRTRIDNTAAVASPHAATASTKLSAAASSLFSLFLPIAMPKSVAALQTRDGPDRSDKIERAALDASGTTPAVHSRANSLRNEESRNNNYNCGASHADARRSSVPAQYSSHQTRNKMCRKESEESEIETEREQDKRGNRRSAQCNLRFVEAKQQCIEICPHTGSRPPSATSSIASSFGMPWATDQIRASRNSTLCTLRSLSVSSESTCGTGNVTEDTASTTSSSRAYYQKCRRSRLLYATPSTGEGVLSGSAEDSAEPGSAHTSRHSEEGHQQVTTGKIVWDTGAVERVMRFPSHSTLTILTLDPSQRSVKRTERYTLISTTERT